MDGRDSVKSLLVLRKREIAVDPARSGPATASLRFWSATAMQEARAALLLAIGLLLSVAGLAGYLWANRAAWPALPVLAIDDLPDLALVDGRGLRLRIGHRRLDGGQRLRGRDRRGEGEQDGEQAKSSHGETPIGPRARGRRPTSGRRSRR